MAEIIDINEVRKNYLEREGWADSSRHTQKMYEEQWKNLYQAFQQSVSLFFGYAKDHFQDSRYNQIIKELDEMVQHLKNDRALLSKDLMNSLYEVARKQLVESNFDKARDLFQLLSILLPGYFDVWLGLGIAFQQLNQHDEAIKAFDLSKKIQPLNPCSYLYTAESYLELKKWHEAEENCKEGLKQSQNDQRPFSDAFQDIIIKCKLRKKA